MSNWKYEEPTPAQKRAIKDYNRVYGVTILVDSKQDAHDVISAYAPKQYLEFENNKVKGTNIPFMIANADKFHNNNYNEMVKKTIKKVVVNGDGTVTLSILRKNNTLALLECLSKGMNKMLDEPSFSEFEDNLGYLSPDDLEEELNDYGANPMWWE